MPGVQASQFGIVSRSLPQPGTDGTEREVRLSRYGGQVVENIVPTKHALADEGAYFVTTNPTPGTALANAISASFSDTVPYLLLNNTDTASSPTAKRIYLDYIKLITTVIPTSGASTQVAAKIDVLRSITTNNYATLTPNNCNMDTGVKSVATCLVQNSATASAVPASSSAARLVQRSTMGLVDIVGDVFIWQYGGLDPAPWQGLTAINAAVNKRLVDNAPPIVIGPQQTFSFYLWFPSNATTGFSGECEIGWWER